MPKFYSSSENDTVRLAEEICRSVGPGSLVLFTGDLGAGKTAFVRGALKAYGNPSHVSSPTFALVNDYGGSPHVYHFDLYRIRDLDDLYSTGFFDYLEDDSILFVEWSERIADAVGDYYADRIVSVDISRTGEENGRVITVKGRGFDADTGN